MLGSRISAAVVFHSCHPRPAPVTSGVITDLPPFNGSHVTPSRLYARWTPSSPFRVKYEKRNASGARVGAAGSERWHPASASTARRAAAPDRDTERLTVSFVSSA